MNERKEEVRYVGPPAVHFYTLAPTTTPPSEPPIPPKVLSAKIYHSTDMWDSGKPLSGSGDVGNEAVDGEIVGDVVPTDIVEELQVEELPGELVEEEIVESVGETGQDLTKH